jgi:hypothetical protein
LALLARKAYRAFGTTFIKIRSKPNKVVDKPRGATLLPYLSFETVTGRNSTFVGLSGEKTEELGGVEYRALKILLWVVGFVSVISVPSTNSTPSTDVFALVPHSSPAPCVHNHRTIHVHLEMGWSVFLSDPISSFNMVRLSLSRSILSHSIQIIIDIGTRHSRRSAHIQTPVRA